jgi:hypothetical protein
VLVRHTLSTRNPPAELGAQLLHQRLRLRGGLLRLLQLRRRCVLRAPRRRLLLLQCLLCGLQLLVCLAALLAQPAGVLAQHLHLLLRGREVGLCHGGRLFQALLLRQQAGRLHG